MHPLTPAIAATLLTLLGSAAILSLPGEKETRYDLTYVDDRGDASVLDVLTIEDCLERVAVLPVLTCEVSTLRPAIVERVTFRAK